MIGRTLRRTVPVVTLSFLLAINFAGCSDGDGGSGASSTSSLIDAQCAASDMCCKAAGNESDPASCKQFFTLFGANAQLGPDAAACEALLRERTADGTYCSLGTKKDGVDVCKNAWITSSNSGTNGTKPAGAECNDDDECAAPAGGEGRCDYRTTWDENNQATTTQTCVQVKPGAAGEGPCGASVQDNGSSSTSYGSSQERLNTFVECYEKDGLYCPEYGQPCKAFAAIGESCTGSFGGGCNPSTAYCNYASGTDGSGPVCALRIAVGEACTSGQTCVAGAGCQNDLCVALKASGEPCEVSSECAGNSCVNKVCSGSSGGATLCFH